jgi:ribose-phosphate pyrophosphokinase
MQNVNQLNSRFGELKLVITKSHPRLGFQIAQALGIKPLDFEIEKFPNRELKIRRLGDVSGCDVCIFSSLHSRYDTIQELKIICNTMQGSASRMFGVFPFVRNGKSDHAKRFGEPISYKVTAADISDSGLKSIAIFDQHSTQHVMAYDTEHTKLERVHHIYLMRLLIEFVRQHLKYDGLLALDDGAYKRNKTIGVNFLKCDDISFIVKHRDAHSRQVIIEKSQIIGDVRGKNIISFDDMIQEAGTVEVGAKIAKFHGAKSITILAVHNDFSPNTFQRLNPLLEDGTIDKLIIVETIPLLDRNKWHKNLVVLSPAKFLAKVIEHIHCEKHMRGFFLEIL